MPLDPAKSATIAPRPFSPMAVLTSPTRLMAVVLILLVIQALGYLALGTGRAGRSVSELALILHNIIALVCTWSAFRRSCGVDRLFWLLFSVAQIALLVPAVILGVSTITNHNLVSEATWRVLYCLYGTPILMMVLLPAWEVVGRRRAETYLDLAQITIVTCLGFFTFFYLPLQHMVPDDALLRNVDLSNLESVFLMLTILLRLRSVPPHRRDSLQRLGLFLLFCALVTFIGNWLDARGLLTWSAWWDLGWSLPYVVASFVSITWTPDPRSAHESESRSFTTFLGRNLVLATYLIIIHSTMDEWPTMQHLVLSNVAVSLFLVAFTVRLALTEYHQQQEITHRRAAQNELSEANRTISDLLEEARIDASAIAQVSQLSSVLQACASQAEAFRILPEWLANIFPGTSGCLTILHLHQSHPEQVARWGTIHIAAPSKEPPGLHPASQVATEGLAPIHSAHISVPLVAGGKALGALLIHNDDESSVTDPAASNEFSRETQIAYSVAEHLSLAIANLHLRETLHLEAIRDPLTELYNRRYMQEVLNREIHRARRRARSFAVLMLDLDHFKNYNDSFGHAAGDMALRLTAQTLLQNVRAEDLCCRYGGEELVVLMPECSLHQAATRAEQIRQRIKNMHTERPADLPAEVTVSIGVAAYPETADSAEVLFRRADESLYQAKHAGRDRVVSARASSAGA